MTTLKNKEVKFVASNDYEDAHFELSWFNFFLQKTDTLIIGKDGLPNYDDFGSDFGRSNSDYRKLCTFLTKPDAEDGHSWQEIVVNHYSQQVIEGQITNPPLAPDAQGWLTSTAIAIGVNLVGALRQAIGTIRARAMTFRRLLH